MKTPSGDVSVTPRCAACAAPLPPGRARRYCRPACRQHAYRTRHQPPTAPTPIPPRRSRPEGTVYSCPQCDQRLLGEQRCQDCNTFATRLGPGGTCHCCDEIILISDLLPGHADEATSPT